MADKTALIITSISPPNQALRSFAEACSTRGIDFIVVGDVKSPDRFDLPGCDFWSIDRQRGLDLDLARHLPERHYARKNLGYLIAMRRGAGIIIESDDDNYPREDFWQKRVPSSAARVAEHAGWINVYRYFSDTAVWPRGFPLQYVQQQPLAYDALPERELYCPIQQGLADENPDVDAVYRLVMHLPITFDRRPRLIVGNASWTPFNSQNTTWFRDAFPLLYLPSYCSFRMCDIWRSFIALRICWANGWGVLFHGPTVWQERNVHNLLKDLEDEVPGYVNNEAICANLEKLRIEPGIHNIADNMVACYRMLIDMKVVGMHELSLLASWIQDVGKATKELT
jgi:hypothetical protein